jgi:predicted flap endonuclease-1-like 5' DNA nuclease
MAPRTVTQAPSLSANAHLEQRLGAVQLELRRLGSERHTLRARLRREAERLLELESALRAERELRRHAAEEHQAALAGVRSRASEAELVKDAEIARLNGELARLAAELESLARLPVATAGKPTAKAPQGLRRIRGIGPAYQRVLEQLGVTRVEQIAAWTASDVASFADRLKIRVDRIAKDDWVGQAQRLGPEPD